MMITSILSVSVLVDALSIAMPLALALTLAVSLALSANVIAKHGTEDKVFLGCELVQRTSHDESDSLKTFPSSEVNIYVLLSCGL